MTVLKTFNEYKNDDALQEATKGQWHKRGLALGAVAGGAVGASGAISSIGINALSSTGVNASIAYTAPMLAVPLAMWGAVAVGVAALIAGYLFAGGKAREDFDKLKMMMKDLKKYDSKSKKTKKDIQGAQKNIDNALYLIGQLKETVHRKLQHGSAKGFLRSDVRDLKSTKDDLDKLERELMSRK